MSKLSPHFATQYLHRSSLGRRNPAGARGLPEPSPIILLRPRRVKLIFRFAESVGLYPPLFGEIRWLADAGLVYLARLPRAGLWHFNCLAVDRATVSWLRSCLSQVPRLPDRHLRAANPIRRAGCSSREEMHPQQVQSPATRFCFHGSHFRRPLTGHQVLSRSALGAALIRCCCDCPTLCA
jgi:hypothetical protein